MSAVDDESLADAGVITQRIRFEGTAFPIDAIIVKKILLAFFQNVRGA